MEDFIIPGHKLSIIDTEQVINMGGPWIGTLLIDDKRISTDCIIDNFIYDEIRHLLFFVKYHSLSNSRGGIYFTINFCNLDGYGIFEFEKSFDMVYLKQLVGDHEIEIYNSGHDNIQNKGIVFNMDGQAFAEIAIT